MALLTDNLISYFKFDGDVVDAVAGAHSGTPTSITYGTGKINQGLTRTPGVTSVVSVPAFTMGPTWSVSLWLNMSGADQNQNTIFTTTANTVGVCADPNRVVSFYAGAPGTFGTNSILGTGWHHLVASCNHNVLRWFKDGVLDSYAYNFLSLGVGNWVPNQLLGANFDTSGRACTMDELAVYIGAALSPVGAAALFNGGNGRAYSTLGTGSGAYFELDAYGFYSAPSIYEQPLVSKNLFEYLGPVAGATYTMRAYHTAAPVGYVYWESPGLPDEEAEHAPYPAVDLADIVVMREQLPA